MKTVDEMQARIQEIEAELRAFKQRLEDESRNPTKDEKSLVNARLTEADELIELIDMEKRRIGLEEKLAKPADPDKAKAMRPTPDDSKRSLNYGEKKPFNSLGDQLQAVMKAGMGQRTDPRLYEVRAPSGLSESVGSEGGFLVQQDFAAELQRVAFETGMLASKCRQIPISSNSNRVTLNGIDETSRASTRWGGILAYWADEAALKTKSKPKFRKIELTLNKLIGLCYGTDELLEDASALESYITQGFGEEFGFQIDDAIINGTGVGRPLGVLNAGCLVSVSAETGQASSTVLFENVTKMWSRLLARSLPNSMWLINQNVWPELFNMYLAVGTGGAPVYIPPGGLSSAPYGTLMGRPVMPIEQCASVGTVGDIILADFNGYLLATKGGMQTDMSIHVRFIYDESVFRFVYRCDGQPMLNSAITPYKGGSSYTQSHFIALATR